MQISEEFELDSLCREKYWHIQGCSAIQGSGVEVSGCGCTLYILMGTPWAHRNNGCIYCL